MAYNQNSTDMIKTQNVENIKKTLKDFKYLGSFIASTEHDINVRIGKAWAALNQMNNIWNSKLSKNLKRNFFRATVESVGTKLEKKNRRSLHSHATGRSERIMERPSYQQRTLWQNSKSNFFDP